MKQKTKTKLKIWVLAIALFNIAVSSTATVTQAAPVLKIDAVQIKDNSSGQSGGSVYGGVFYTLLLDGKTLPVLRPGSLECGGCEVTWSVDGKALSINNLTQITSSDVAKLSTNGKVLSAKVVQKGFTYTDSQSLTVPDSTKTMDQMNASHKPETIYQTPQKTTSVISSLSQGQICAPDDSSAGSKYNLARCINNIYTFAVAIGGFVAVLMFVLAGYFYAQGGNENISKAKSFINSTLVGLLLLFGTYALLNTIDPNLTSVPKIELPNDFCGTVTDSKTGQTQNTCDNLPSDNPYTDNPDGTPRYTTGVNVPSPGTKVGAKTVQPCNNCLDITSAAFKLTAKNHNYLEANLASALLQTSSRFGNFRVTEAWPPSSEHQEDCHYDGTCADVAIYKSGAPGDVTTNDSVTAIKQLCTSLKQSGLTILNEYTIIPASKFAGSDCPAPVSTSKATGNHLHVKLAK
jgi:hypothetical protein